MEFLGDVVGWIGDLTRTIWTFVKEYQSLTAGLLALVAAYLAARPVWKQLHVLTKQAEFQSRDIIKLKIKQLTSIADKIEKETNELGTHLRRAQNIYHGYEKNPDPLNPHDAHSLELGIRSLEDWIGTLLDNRDLPDGIDDDLSAVIDKAKVFGRTLGSIHAPASVDFGDPDYGFENPKKAEQEALKEAEEALTEVNDHFDGFQSAINTVTAKITAHAQALRGRLREIEAKLL